MCTQFALEFIGDFFQVYCWFGQYHFAYNEFVVTQRPTKFLNWANIDSV